MQEAACQRGEPCRSLMTFYFINILFHNEFLTFSFLVDYHLELLEKTQENNTYFCQVLFTKYKTLTSDEDEVSGTPFNLGIDIFPSRKITSNCGTEGPTYLDSLFIGPT